jgi:FAD synthetase
MSLVFPPNLAFPTSLLSKVTASLVIVRKAFEEYDGKIGVAFNGGKDSAVLVDLVSRVHRSTKVDTQLPSFHFRNRHEFEEIDEYIGKAKSHWGLDHHLIRCGSLKDGLRSAMCDHGLEAIFLGLRSSDPEGVGVGHFAMTSDDWPRAMRVMPILDWTYHDVWTYIDLLSIPICSLYEKGYTSIGNKYNTEPNPELFDWEAGSYGHARDLRDLALERRGRMSKLLSVNNNTI